MPYRKVTSEFCESGTSLFKTSIEKLLNNFVVFNVSDMRSISTVESCLSTEVLKLNLMKMKIYFMKEEV